MEEPLVKIHYWLYPISWIYGMGVRLRNKLFDWGYYRSKSFDVPVVCVGNLAVGGTGKTPHTEYLIKLLQQTGTNVAMLSRGYKRKSKGYVLATEETDVRAAISGILYEVKRALKAGRIARLGDLGSLQIGLNSEGAASVKEFSGSMIKGAHLIFRPSKTLAELMKILSYQQVLTRAVAQAGAGDGGGEDPDKNPDSGGDGSGDEEAPDPTV